MKPKTARIVQRHDLVNGFVQLDLQLPTPLGAQPGQSVTLNQQFSCYVQDCLDQSLSMILSKDQSQQLGPLTQLEISNLAGIPLPEPNPNQYTLLCVEEEGLNACLFYLKKFRLPFHGLVLIGTHHAFAFKPRPSQMVIENVPAGVIATLPLLEDWGIANRLANEQEQPGCYEGTVQALAQYWSMRQQPEQLIEINALTL